MADLKDLVYKISYDVKDKSIRDAEENADGLNDNINKSKKGIDGFNTKASATESIFGKLAKVAVTAFAVDKLKDFGMAVISTGADFEQSMANVRSIMMPTNEEFEKLEAAALKAGKTTKFSATESSEALSYMALAGFDATEAVGALPSVLNLAAAGNVDLARASDLVTDAMTPLKLEVGELDGFVDKLARTSQKSNTNVEQLGEAILVAGGVATDAGLSTTALATQLGILADSGKKGAEGGTALRNVLLNLTAPNKKVKELLEEMNVKVADADGNFRDFNSILIDLNKSMGKYSQEQQQAIKETIGGKENVQALNILLQGAGQRYTELSGAIRNSSGAAQEMADVQMNTLKGSFLTLKSGIEGTLISIGKNSDLNEKLREVVDKLIENLPMFEAVATKAFTALGDAIIFVIDNGNILIPIISGIATVMGALKIIGIINGLLSIFNVTTGTGTLVQIGFNTALWACPVVWIVAAIAGIIAALVALYLNFDKVKEFVVKLWDKLNNNPFTKFLLAMNPVTLAIQLLTGKFKAVTDAIKGAWNWLTSWFDEAPDGNIKVEAVRSKDGKTEISKFAKGTYNTPDTFIAGENGPELVTGMPNRRVYTASETSGLMSDGKRGDVKISVNVNYYGNDKSVGQVVKAEMENVFNDLMVKYDFQVT